MNFVKYDNQEMTFITNIQWSYTDKALNKIFCWVYNLYLKQISSSQLRRLLMGIYLQDCMTDVTFFSL